MEGWPCLAPAGREDRRPRTLIPLTTRATRRSSMTREQPWARSLCDLKWPRPPCSNHPASARCRLFQSPCPFPRRPSRCRCWPQPSRERHSRRPRSCRRVCHLAFSYWRHVRRVGRHFWVTAIGSLFLLCHANVVRCGPPPSGRPHRSVVAGAAIFCALAATADAHVQFESEVRRLGFGGLLELNDDVVAFTFGQFRLAGE